MTVTPCATTVQESLPDEVVGAVLAVSHSDDVDSHLLGGAIFAAWEYR